MRTVDEKFRYNNERKEPFSVGYVMGVVIYRGYEVSASSEQKSAHKKFIDDMKRQATNGDQYSKGIMCAIRDCANERKAKKNK